MDHGPRRRKYYSRRTFSCVFITGIAAFVFGMQLLAHHRVLHSFSAHKEWVPRLPGVSDAAGSHLSGLSLHGSAAVNSSACSCNCSGGGSSGAPFRSEDAAGAAAGAPPLEIVVPEWPRNSSSVTFPDIAAQVLAAERQGRGRKVIAMSLYGDNPRYTFGGLDNAVLAKRDWPGWTLRFYVGDGVPPEMLALYRTLGVELVHMTGNQRGIAGMFWRFFAVEDRTITRVLVRDIDSRLTNRDRAAVAEWIKSGRYFHTMRDNEWHKTVILGGIWGTVGGFINPAVLEAWRSQDDRAPRAYQKGDDQAWLATELWPHVREHNLMHASFHCTHYKTAWRPFPTRRTGPTDFVGNVYAPRTHFTGRFMYDECPRECRKNVTWIYC